MKKYRSAYLCIYRLSVDMEFARGLEELAKDLVVCGVQGKPDAEVAERAMQLRAIATLSVCTGHIDTQAFEGIGVQVVRSRTANTDAVAGHSIALTFAVQKGSLRSDASVGNGSVQSRLAA